MASRRPVSFKDNERDRRLQRIVDEQGDKSNFIKDAIEFYIEHGNIKLNAKVPRDSSNLNETMDPDDADEINNILG